MSTTPKRWRRPDNRSAVDGVFVTEDLHNFGADYDPTLMAWNENFQRNWPTIRDRYGDAFRRLWTLYLRTCAGAFRCRKYQLWQLVFSRTGVPGGYQATRALDGELAVGQKPARTNRSAAQREHRWPQPETESSSP